MMQGSAATVRNTVWLTVWLLQAGLAITAPSSDKQLETMMQQPHQQQHHSSRSNRQQCL